MEYMDFRLLRGRQVRVDTRNVASAIAASCARPLRILVSAPFFLLKCRRRMSDDDEWASASHLFLPRDGLITDSDGIIIAAILRFQF